MSRYCLDSDWSKVPEPREVQTQLAEWVEVAPRRWLRKARKWE